LTHTDAEYVARILGCMSDNVIIFADGTFRQNIEWFNLEDLLRTMQHRGQGIDKKKLRPFLDELSEEENPDKKLSGFLEKREGKKQSKTQSKGEYTLRDKGKFWFQDYKKTIL